MAIDKANFDDITEEDLNALVDGGVPEGLTIDYKRDTYGKSDADKREFLKDISSFANTIGGHLVIGVVDVDALPTQIVGLPGVDIDTELQRLESMAASGLEPRIQIRMGRVMLANGTSAIVIRVPQSWIAPHRVAAQDYNRFFKRNSSGCYQPSVDELRNMFNANNDLATRVQTFRDQRIALIRGGGLWRALKENGQAILHVLPTSSFAGQHVVDLAAAVNSRSLFDPLEVPSHLPLRYNLDGAVTERGNPEMAGYTQLFRDGRIESTKGNLLLSTKYGPSIAAPPLELACMLTLRRLMAGLRLMDVPPPFAISLSLIGCESACYQTRVFEWADERPAPLHRSVVTLPVGQINSYGDHAVIDAGLRPAFDALWNAAGFPHAQWFNAAGEWIGPPGMVAG
jgi:hypothetical protein